jgi:hypothetical protein
MDLILETPAKVTEENLDELVEKEVEEQLEQIDESEYDESLDGEGEVSVLGMTFYPSDIIKNCDPVAYRIGFTEYQDFRREDIEADVREELEALIE